MLRFFRINDPYRLIVIFIVMLVLRLPIMLSENTLTYPELDYLLVGEKLSDGNKLYSEIWTRLGPLSSIVYGVFDFLFGRSQLALQIVSLLVVFFQSFIFNKILLINKAFNENTYVPGLVYALLMSWFFDLYALSPSILGLTFILLAMNNVLSHFEFKAKRDEAIHNIGVHIGVATLFYLPYVIFMPLVILAFLFFSGTVFRRYLLMIYGFLLPIALTTVLYMMTGRLTDYVINFIYPTLGTTATPFFDWKILLLIFSVPIIFLVLGFAAVLQRGRFTVFQTNLSQFMMLWMAFGIIYIFLVRIVVPANLIIFIPPLSYFISQYFLNVRKKWIAEVIFLLFFASPVLFNLGTFFGFFVTGQVVDTGQYVVQASPYSEEIHDKKVLVLGSDMSHYLDSTPATPFLEWGLAKKIFNELDYYDNLSLIGEGFEGDMPDVIIDQEKLMPDLKKKIPAFQAYRTTDGTLYQR